MKLKHFIGKEVVCTSTKEHFIIDKIDGAFIEVRTINKNQYGTYSHFCWKTGTAPYDNAIVAGNLVFIDETLFEPFKEIYEEYRMTDGRYDAYFYNMCHFD